MATKCYIFGAGDYFGGLPAISDGGFVIAADGGYTKLLDAGIKPDLIIGDFDSLGYVPTSGNVLQFRAEKDDTDTGLAVDEGIRHGCTEFFIYGGTGGRLDHTLANIQCVARLSQSGCRGYLFGDGYVITAITNGSITFDASQRGYISVFAHGEKAVGVYETGLKYALDDATLTNTTPLGVSNEFTDQASEVSVRSGTLIILYQNA